MPTVEVAGAEGHIELHYDIFASGNNRPWVVFAHGAGGNAACWWQQVPVFFDQFNVITFDHRAFGRSRCTRADFDPGRFVGDLRAVLDHAEVDQAALVCQSMGGWTGLGLALESPERVWAVVMSHTVGGLAQEATAIARKEMAASAAQPSEPFGSWAVALDLPDKDPALSHLYNCIYNMNQDFLAFGGLQAFASNTPQLDPALVAQYRLPTLFVTGDADIVIPKAAVEAAHAEIAHSELVNLGAVGHSSYFEDAARFNAVVLKFLGRHL